MASYSSTKKSTTQITTNTSQGGNQQVGGNLNNSVANVANVGAFANVAVTTTDFGAIQEGVSLARDVSANAFEISQKEIANSRDVLTKYFDQANTNNKNFYDIAANATGTNDFKKLVAIGVGIIAVIYILKAKK